MSTMHAGFGQTMTRASLVPFFVFVSVLAYLVPGQFPPGTSTTAPARSSPVWKAMYSEQYPGCVATVLWPAAETPVALVVMSADGSTTMVSREEARRRAALGQVARTIGACRPAG